IAAERLRAVNQLGKLIHDGQVAVKGTPATAESKPVDPPPAPPAPPPVDVTRRKPVPDAARQKEAEKLVRELFKEQYANKARSDKKALARMLLDQASKSRDDSVALWVLYREAADAAAQGGDLRGTVESLEGAARDFDVDPLAMKVEALGAFA